MNDLTQEQADRLAKWRWGPDAAAWQEGVACYVSVPGQRMRHRFADTFTAAFRASMQSPMTDQDAELEAKLRWGMDASAWVSGAKYVGTKENPRGCAGTQNWWEEVFDSADGVRRNWREYAARFAPDELGHCAACGEQLGITPIRGRWCSPSCAGETLAPLIPDLTPEEATAEAKRRWGDGYAFPAVGKAPLAVGCPGKAYGTGATFREALARAESNRVFRALATAFGTVGCAAVRERNKVIGQAMMEPPEWAYRKAWESAIVAAVEWANARPLPFALPGSYTRGVLPRALRTYHDDRTRLCAVEALKRQVHPGPELTSTFAAAVCAAYERGRHGGGR